jgi:hypothetical protein
MVILSVVFVSVVVLNVVFVSVVVLNVVAYVLSTLTYQGMFVTIICPLKTPRPSPIMTFSTTGLSITISNIQLNMAQLDAVFFKLLYWVSLCWV